MGILYLGFLGTALARLILDVSDAWLVAGAALLAAGFAVSRLDPDGFGPRRGWRVTIDSDGVTAEQVHGPGGSGGSVKWADLVEVGILTTADGPALDDFFWVLRGQGETRTVVPIGLAEQVDLLPRLQRLQGFDNMAVTRASGSITEAVFCCWLGQPGEGVVASGEPSA
ncbi:MAG: hypothetical protein GXP62_11695 [Oligoflexia bacterium]|nr:hypothetical protein [Oligoflexia bacterium]